MDLPFYLPEGDFTTKKGEVKFWAHVDQNIHLKKGSPNSWQGILYVSDSCGDNSATVVLPQSHKKIYDEIVSDPAADLKNAKRGGGHGIEILKLEPILRDKMIGLWMKHSRRIQVPAGALLLYNSKLTH